MTDFKTRCYRLLMSRVVLMLLNALLVYFASLILWDLGREALEGRLHAHEMEYVIEGMAVLGIAFGVALECRKDLMEIFGLYPRYESETELSIDQVCHDFGIGYLLFGLFMEIPIQAVKVPDHVFNTSGAELATLFASIPFVLATGAIGVKAIWRLFRLPPARAGH